MIAPAVTLGYAGHRIHVTSDDPATLVWLVEFLGPDFDACASGNPDHWVTVRTDTRAFDALRALGPHPGGDSIGCFALDGEVITLPRWTSRPGDVVLFDAPLRVFYRREPDAARIEILSTPGNLGARVALLRVVREIATANRVAGDGVIVHGAALAWRGRGYVIAGPKNAGKTTLLLHLLWNTGATYMANDRAMIWHNAVPVRLRGMPTIVSVRASSLVHLPHLAEAFQHRPYHHRFSLDESDAVAHPAAESATGAANTSGVTPAQLARLLGVSRSGELPLAAVIFPQRAEAPSGARIEPLDAEETVVRLRAALFRAHARSLVGEFFTDCPPDGMSDPRDSLCAALARRIPGVACILGPNAYLTAGSAMRVLTALEQHTSHQWSSRNR